MIPSTPTCGQSLSLRLEGRDEMKPRPAGERYAELLVLAAVASLLVTQVPTQAGTTSERGIHAVSNMTSRAVPTLFNGRAIGSRPAGAKDIPTAIRAFSRVATETRHERHDGSPQRRSQ